MKIREWAAVVIAMAALCVARPAAGAEEFQAAVHKAWSSSVLVEDSQAVARMCTETDDVMLALDMEPDAQGVGWSMFMTGEASDGMKLLAGGTEGGVLVRAHARGQGQNIRRAI